MKSLNGTNDFTVGSISKSLILYSLPIFISFLLNTIYSAVDYLMITIFCEATSKAAISSATTVIMIIVSLISGLANGICVLVGQYFGAKKLDKCEKIYKNGTMILLFIDIILAIFLAATSYFIPSIMQISIEARDEMFKYLLIFSFSLPFLGIYNTISATLRGLGNSFAPMLFILIATVFNISLDYLFLAVFNFGIIGAAFATLIGHMISCFAAIFYINYKKPPFNVSFKNFSFENDYIGKFFKYGLPLALQDSLVYLSFAIIMAFMSTKGIIYTNSEGFSDRITAIFFVPLSSIGNSIATCSSQCLGIGDTERAKKYMKKGMLISIIVGFLCGIITIAFCLYQLVVVDGLNFGDMISKDVNERTLSYFYLAVATLDLFVCSIIFPINNLFIGGGHTTFAMGQNLASTFIVRVPMAIVACHFLDNPSFYVGLSYSFSSVFSLIFCLFYYYKGYWKKNINKLEIIPEG